MSVRMLNSYSARNRYVGHSIGDVNLCNFFVAVIYVYIENTLYNQSRNRCYMNLIHIMECATRLSSDLLGNSHVPVLP